MAERLGREEGLRVGHSAGAAVAGALEVARRMASVGEEGNVVTVLPDRADRYFEPRRWARRIAW
jgi:cysteine synthase